MDLTPEAQEAVRVADEAITRYQAGVPRLREFPASAIPKLIQALVVWKAAAMSEKARADDLERQRRQMQV